MEEGKIIFDDNGVPTSYKAFEDGRVWSEKTRRFLSGSINPAGYISVRLTFPDGKKYGKLIHRLIAEAFLDNPEKLPIVNHIDGDKSNNAAENLEWCSAKDNVSHAYDLGLCMGGAGPRERGDFTEGEEWKPFRDSNYLVSRCGRVFNKKTKILLRQNPAKTGYVRYSIRMDGETFAMLGHVMVWEVWGTGPVEEGFVINHKDGDRCNNSIDNLEVLSKSENAIHSCYTLGNNVKRVEITNVKTREKREFSSVTLAAKNISATPGAITMANKESRPVKGWLVKYL